MYTWELLKTNEFESLINLKVEKVQTRFLSDYWLKPGEIWSLCGLERYGRPVKLSTRAGNTG